MEELRSRISLLKSTLSSLKQNYWNIYKSIMETGKTPPFLFPTLAFNNLENILNQYTLNYNPDSDHYSLILSLNTIDLSLYYVL